MSRIDVIIPVYNAEKYIERCLDSVLRQTYDDYQVIVVNDGSTDKSLEICENYSNRDARIKVISQDNAGPDIARKTGVMHSESEFIMFLDADDYLSDDAMSVLVAYADESKADMVCCQIERFNDAGKIWSGSKQVGEIVTYESTGDIMGGYFEDGILMGTYYAKLIRKELIKDYAFVKDSVIGEDISAALYMLQKARKVWVVPECCYYYYWNLDSISHSGYTPRHKRSLENYISLRDELLSKNYVSPITVNGYFAEYEMAVATAMARNLKYDKDAAKLLKSDIKKHWRYIRANKKTPIYMKICMLIYLISPHIFVGLYRIVYLLTGR